MELFSFRFTSCALLLVCTIWTVTDISSAQSAPQDVAKVDVVGQTDTSITIQFDKVADIPEYRLYYGAANPQTIPAGDNNPIRYTLPDLSPAQKYSMSLRSRAADGTESTGYSFNAITAPQNPGFLLAANRDETSIQLQWGEVSGITDYIIKYTQEISVTGKTNETVKNLQSGTTYSFTVFAVFENVRSSGLQVSMSTDPPPVSSVKTTKQTLTSVTLEWQSVRKDYEYLVEMDGRSETISPKEGLISHTVSSLKAGTVYSVNIITVYRRSPILTFKSRPFPVNTLTEISWQVTNTTIQGKVNGRVTSATASNGTKQHDNSGIGSDIKFTGLYPGATYNVKLTDEGQWQSTQSVAVLPSKLTAKCKFWNRGYSIYIEWDKPSGLWDLVEVNVSKKVHEVGKDGELNAILPNFQPARKYKVSVSSRSGQQRSSPYVFTCKTDDRGVIAGAFFGALLFLILVGVIVYVIIKRPGCKRRSSSAAGGARPSARQSNAMPSGVSPAQNELRADVNKRYN